MLDRPVYSARVTEKIVIRCNNFPRRVVQQIMKNIHNEQANLNTTGVPSTV